MKFTVQIAVKAFPWDDLRFFRTRETEAENIEEAVVNYIMEPVDLLAARFKPKEIPSLETQS